MKEYYDHPIFGRLTDEEDIRIAKRQEEEAEYQRIMDMLAEEYYWKKIDEEQYQRYFGEDFNKVEGD